MQKKSIFIIVLAAIVACENSENEPKSQQIKSSIKGIDFSNQKPESPDWENVKEHYRFVISRSVRAVDTNPNEGQHTWESRPDSNFIKNWKDLASNKITRGAYHLFSPQVSGAEQYQVFKKTVTLKKGDLPPILDAITNECDLNQAEVWLDMAAKDCKCDPILYVDENSIEKVSKKIAEYYLWLDTPNEKTFRKLKSNYSRIVFWQNKKDSNLSEFSEKVDFNEFIGEESDFQDLLIK
ncbi:MAG: glycoside hydrolase family 25 protein [Crocinitomicaceae bacterium]|jgi:GH25 family lysozyme M1 (1,4-beta-N-acetylmuramidase)